MNESYIEGRFTIVMEEIKDALIGIEAQLKEMNTRLTTFEQCVESKTPVRMIRVTDMGKTTTIT